MANAERTLGHTCVQSAGLETVELLRRGALEESLGDMTYLSRFSWSARLARQVTGNAIVQL